MSTIENDYYLKINKIVARILDARVEITASFVDIINHRAHI